MKISGKIIEIKETQQVSETFKKRNIVVEYIEDGGYPEYITFELIQDRCNLVDGFQEGKDITVSFNLKGRKWVTPEGETRYFNSLHAWRVEAMDNNSNSGNTQSAPKNSQELTVISKNSPQQFKKGPQKRSHVRAMGWRTARSALHIHQDGRVERPPQSFAGCSGQAEWT